LGGIKMKKAKGLLAIALVLIILVGNIGSISASSYNSVANVDGGSFTTLDDPLPKGQ